MGLRKWLAARRLPIDALFAQRPQVAAGIGGLVLVELGASEHALLVDLLSSIRHADTDAEDKGRQILGLRVQAVAMSLRTPSGRVPYDWRKQDDLFAVAMLPRTRLVSAMDAVADLCEMPWLSPTETAKAAQAQDAEPEVALEEAPDPANP